MDYFVIESPKAEVANNIKLFMLKENHSQMGGAIMMFRALGVLVIPLVLAGCIKINITAGSGIQAGDGGPGRGGACMLNGNGQCICTGSCTCGPPKQCVPGTP